MLVERQDVSLISLINRKAEWIFQARKSNAT